MTAPIQPPPAAELAALYAEHKSTRRVAEHYGVHPVTAWKWCRQAGVTMLPAGWYQERRGHTPPNHPWRQGVLENRAQWPRKEINQENVI